MVRGLIKLSNSNTLFLFGAKSAGDQRALVSKTILKLCISFQRLGIGPVKLKSGPWTSVQRITWGSAAIFGWML